MKWVHLCHCLNILWHCLSLGLEWKLIFSSLVAAAEFSKFAGILSAELSQYHLLEFEIALLEFHHLQLALFIVMPPKAHLTSHIGMSGSRWVMTPSWLSGSLRSFLYSSVYWASLVAQLVKNPPATQETWVKSLGWEDTPGGGQGHPLQYSCLENPHGQRNLSGCSPWACRVGHDWVT